MTKRLYKYFVFSWKDTFITILLLTVTFGVCFLIQNYIPDSSNYSSLLFLFTVFLISRFTKGYLFGIISSIIASFVVNFAFTTPYFRLSFSIPGYILTFFIMLSIAFLTSIMTTRILEEEKVKIEAERNV